MEKILIVEDDNRAAAKMESAIIGDERDFRSVDNYEDAVLELESFRPDLVLLDLGIYASNENRYTNSQDLAMGNKLIDDVEEWNEKRHGSNIQIILVSANVDDAVRRINISKRDYVVAIVNKKDPRGYEERLSAVVNNAFEFPKIVKKTVMYDGLDKLKSQLMGSNEVLGIMLNDSILKSFEEDQHTRAIIMCGSLVKCLYEEFTLSNEDLKGLFSRSNQNTERRENTKKWSEKWSELVNKDIVREIDKHLALGIIYTRNSVAHPEGSVRIIKPTMDDTAAVLQMLVPLVNQYLIFKQKNKTNE